MKVVIGVNVKFKNIHLLQELKTKYGCFIIAPKHQSELETLIFSMFLTSFRIVYKKEMNKIPVIGHYMRRMNFITIDRSDGKSAIQCLIQQGQDSVINNTPVLIFPEGTRTLFGQRGHYHIGIALMYESMGVPILPVAHNAGECFVRNSFIKYPGTITFWLLPPILPGHPVRDVIAMIETCIESACDDLVENKNLSNNQIIC
ncbi:MAG: 1-acyl-sn-glycerol-3-phosphate acyltransferase [Holosporales bacterium]|jgi:1-acyl-sn-glycerol-3-phosphate acyltransferase|nr:1-acyl-sn-glycerol-3-phosphate acyltransferase [Holosporales bacterium]